MSNHIVLEPFDFILETYEQGIPGPPGPPGPPGQAGVVYTHNQNSASNNWVINHNMGRYVNVAVYSTGGTQMLAEVIHINMNQTQIFFDTALQGTAICT